MNLPEPTTDAVCCQVQAAAGPSCQVSVIIKTLNEERNIQRAVESALAAVRAVGGEVIVADSCSTDQTVALASAYPVRVVQLQNPADRSCGVGPQLGYLHSRGEFVYIMDGDMRMQPDFLRVAVAHLRAHPELGGVGGQIVEKNSTSLEYLARVERDAQHMAPGAVDRLDMGGLYRREAVESVGYMSDRNLHSYEEFDLALRLRVRGWGLWRLPAPSCEHWGHDAPPYQLLMRRWTSRYALGLGEMLHASVSQGTLTHALRDVRELRIYGLVLVWWGCMVLALGGVFLGSVSWWWALIATLSLPSLILVKKKSLAKALYAVTAWFVNVAGVLRGLIQPRRDPAKPIPSRVMHDGVC